jgi:outer membrane receptor protein involved in Fe transport
MEARRMMARVRARMQPLLLCLLLWLSLPVAVYGAGAVSGLVLDGRTGQPVRGASLAFEGTEVASSSDLNGVFQARLAAGTYSAVVTAAGYQTQKVVDVVVRDGQEANVSVVLMPKSDASASADGQPATGISEEITVQAEAVDATAAAMLTERRSSAQIVDNIGSEEISKNSGSDAAAALRRVTGISLQDDKYVFVRGLGDRYSNTQLNGTKLPSTEFERKVVPLDLFAADLLEKVTVSKSYTADQPGDFVAGVVELETKQFPPQQRLSVGVSAGANTVTTGEPWLLYPGGVSGSGSGGQPLPSGIPDEPLLRTSIVTGDGFNADELERFGEQLIGSWTPQGDDGPWDRGLKASYGNSFGRFGLLVSAGWDNDHSVREEQRAYFSVPGPGRPVDQLSHFDFDYGTEQVRHSLMGNLAVRAGENSQLRFRGLSTSLSEAESRFQEGFLADSNNDIRDYRLAFKEQEVDSFQIAGDHFLPGWGSSGSLLEWRGAASSATTAENLRETLYSDSGIAGFRLANLGQSGFFYFNDLDDQLGDLRVDFSRFHTGERSFGTLKAGVASTRSERDFGGRRLRNFPRRTSGIDLTLPAEQIYTEENIDPDGFEIREVTNPTDTYSGEQDVRAAYLQADWSFGDWRFIGGVRLEESEQELISFDRIEPDKAVSTVLDDTDLLPALTLVYSLGERTALRASLSRTVNRPEFRELAPFEFKAIVGGTNTRGNPELVRATVDSADLRWEFFPSGGEVLAASVFYKRFDDPIEGVLIGGADLFETYINADEATNYGFEVEARKNLGFVTGALSSFTGIINYTWVESEISIPAGTSILTNLDRPLSGQPDSVLNVVLEWAPERFDATSVRLLYNMVGDRVILGGAQGLPDVFEDSRSTVDLTWIQGLWRDLSLKLTGGNLLDEERLFSQGGQPWRLYQPGRSYSLSLGYSF